jgi:hypothetical protein
MEIIPSESIIWAGSNDTGETVIKYFFALAESYQELIHR